ncbi:MAG: hypothetical protein KDI79_05020 [Anaerolineae bacterium]|nr:hypothetical protein [Anaerolineae bacterium]
MIKQDNILQRQTFGAGLLNLFQQRSVQLLIAGWVAGLMVVLAIGIEGLPTPVFGESATLAVLGQLGLLTAELLIIAIIYATTRHRSPVNFAARVGKWDRTVTETGLFWGYIVIALALGGYVGFGLHPEGTIFGPLRQVRPGELVAWAGFNFVLFGLIPYVAFRALGYTHDDLGLTSNNLRADVLLILLVLSIEALFELTGFTGIFYLTPTQLLTGIPLSFLIHLFGTGLPIMICIHSILIPRYMQLTGSMVTSTILGGLTYAAFHIFEYWTVFDTASLSLLSVIFVFSQFTGPGMVKAILTLRTGNAWVHLWSYHAIAPHVMIDTPHIVEVFKLR